MTSLIIAVSFCACGSSSNETNSAELEDAIDYSVIQENMSNFMNENTYCVYDGWIYTMGGQESSGQPIFKKMRIDGSEDTVLTKKGAPTYVTIDGEFIYTVLWDEEESCVYRCRLGGDDLKKLTNDSVEYLQVTDEYLYYNKFDYEKGITKGYYRCEKDGSNEELVYDKEIYYSYIVGDILYYQDDNDGETIHAYNLETKEDKRITESISYGYVIDSKYIYYIGNDKSVSEEDYKGHIIQRDLETGDEVKLYDGVDVGSIVLKDNHLYFINENDSNRIYRIGIDGEDIKLISQDTNCSNIAVFGDKLMYIDRNSENEQIENIYISNLDGSNKIDLGHSN